MVRRPFLLIVMVVSAISLLSGAVNPAKAQEIKTLKYEDTVSSEITAEVFEESYSFTGKKGDLVGIEMTYDVTGPLLSFAALTVFGPNTKRLGVADSGSSNGYVRFIFMKLPVDGEYLIKAGRLKQDKTNGIGKYTLHLFQVPVLEAGKTVSSELAINSDKSVREAYYIVKSNQNFRLDMTLGETVPAIVLRARLAVYRYITDTQMPNEVEVEGNYLNQSVTLPGIDTFYLVRLRIPQYVSLKGSPEPSRPFTISVSPAS